MDSFAVLVQYRINIVKTHVRTFFAQIIFVALLPAFAAEPIRFSSDDVVAFIGSGDTSAAQFSGHIESLLVRAFPETKYRNFGWEGDTVFTQPRDFNFPPLKHHLKKAGVTVAFIQFGRVEALSLEKADFTSAYRKFLAEIQEIAPTVILVTPIPFEKPSDPLPDLSARNAALAELSASIRAIGSEKNLKVIDLFSALSDRKVKHLTEDGLQLTPFGHSVVALTFAQALNIPTNDQASTDGSWQNKTLERLRQTIIAKNQLWFNYWRPQNWAFLGGDRTEQPSSRDHRDPKVRWFPAEMEKYPELIVTREREIAALAREIKEN